MTNLAESRSDTAGVHRQVMEIVASRTLYDESYLLPESHFEGELGIDSVILESILVTVKEHFGLSSDLPPGLSTIKELADAVESELTTTPRSPAGEPPAGEPATGEPADDVLLETIVATTMRHTLYQRHQLDLDAEFEGELGIDSVVLSSIVADVAQELRLAGSVPATVTAPTLRVLIAELRPYQPSTLSQASRQAEA
ncbi:MAG: acyl carrier protein, partial [Candidatus Limnocylindrales bacterium]